MMTNFIAAMLAMAIGIVIVLLYVLVDMLLADIAVERGIARAWRIIAQIEAGHDDSH